MSWRGAIRRKATAVAAVTAVVAAMVGVGGVTAGASSPQAASPKGTTLLIGGRVADIGRDGVGALDVHARHPRRVDEVDERQRRHRRPPGEDRLRARRQG
jgi:hypothetical protein